MERRAQELSDQHKLQLIENGKSNDTSSSTSCISANRIIQNPVENHKFLLEHGSLKSESTTKKYATSIGEDEKIERCHIGVISPLTSEVALNQKGKQGATEQFLDAYEIRDSSRLNSSGITRRMFRKRWFNELYNKSEVKECLEYIKSVSNVKRLNRLLYPEQREHAQQEKTKPIYIKERILSEETAEMKNHTETKSKCIVYDDTFVTPKRNMPAIQEIAYAISTPGTSINDTSSNTSSEIISGNNSSKTKSVKQINDPALIPVACPSFKSSEIISANSASEIIQNETFFDELRNILSTISSKSPEETDNLILHQNTNIKTLISTGISSTSDSLTSDYLSKLGSSGDNLSARKAEDQSRKRNPADEKLEIDVSKKIKIEDDDENYVNIPPVSIKEVKDVQLTSPRTCSTPDFATSNHLSKFVSSDVDFNTSEAEDQASKRNFADEIKENEVLNKIKTEKEDNSDVNFQPVARKDVQETVEKKFSEILYTSSKDPEQTQIMSPKPANVTQKDNAIDTLPFRNNEDERKLLMLETLNAQPNAPLSSNTCGAYNETVVSDSTENTELMSSSYNLKPPSAVSSGVKRKLKSEDGINSSENLQCRQKYFIKQNIDGALYPCLRENESYGPRTITLQNIQSFGYPSTTLIPVNMAPAHTLILHTGTFLSDSSVLLPTNIIPDLQSRNTLLLDSKSRVTFPASIKTETPDDSDEEVVCLGTFPDRRGNTVPKKKLSQTQLAKFVPTNEVLFSLLEWNACWLPIQKKTNLCPPIWDEYHDIKDSYESENEYYNIYFPLYLLSIWLKIYDSWDICHSAAHYKVRFEHCEEKRNYVKITCSGILTNADFDNFPTDDGIILVTVIKSGGREDKLFGCIYSLSEQHCDQSSWDRKEYKVISISFYTAEKLNIAAKEYFKIQKLCNIRVSLKQNDALISLKTSGMKNLVLKPKDHKSQISSFTWHTSVKFQPYLTEVVSCITSKKLTLIDIPSSNSRENLIIELVRKLNNCDCTVLVCLKDRNTLVNLALLLLNGHCKLVIAVKASEIKLPDSLKKHTLRELTTAKNREKSPPEFATSEVLKHSNVILTVLSCIYFFDMGTDFPASNLTCIIDEAHLFPETQTMLPFIYNLKSLVLLGDSKKQAELHPFLDKFGYNKSFYSRLYNVAKNN